MPATIPAALAAELPIPLPGLMFFSIRISKPSCALCALRMANPATPATFFSASIGKSCPLMEVMCMPAFSLRRISIRSPMFSRQSPKTSKPQEILAILAGANSLTPFTSTFSNSYDICKYSRSGHISTSTCPFDNQRLLCISVCVEQHDVVTALKVIEIMPLGDMF